MPNVPYIRKNEEVKQTQKLEVGLFIRVNNLADNFKIISISRSDDKLYVVANKNSDTVMIEWNKNNLTVHTTYISPDKVTHFDGVPSIIVRNGVGASIKADFNTTLGEIVYQGTAYQDVERPVKIGDVLTTRNKNFVVEYIASDGSIIALVEGKSQAKMTKECVMLKHTDKTLLQAIHEKLIWKWK